MTGDAARPAAPVIRRVLGRTGLRVPVVSLGCGLVDTPQLARAALDEGLVYFDTAPPYGGGKNESILGEVFQGRPRESFIVGTKIGLPEDTRTGLLPETITPEAFRTYFRNSLEASLQSLRLESVDILYLYGPAQPDYLTLPMVKETLLELKATGKTRFIGVSFHQNEPAMLRAAVEQKIYDVVLTSYNFRQPHREDVRAAIAAAASAGLGVVAMKTMAGVYWDRERRQPIDAGAAMRWVLQDPNVHTIVPGVSSFDQLALNVALLRDITLTPGDREALRLERKTAQHGLYCAQCGSCREQCRQGLDIPTAMRSYMYAYGYRRAALAQATLQRRTPEAFTCAGCARCAVTCPQGFRVATRLRDVVRLLDVPTDFLA
jgi:predicted aldo/keto reductase-like oxidoreductase